MSHLEREIFEQPEVLEQLFDDTAAPAVARDLRESGRETVVTVARGSSGNAITFFSYLVGQQLGMPVADVPPSLLTLYGAQMKLRSAVAVGVSQSGRSEDVRLSLQGLRDGGALTVAVTNDGGSPMAQLADHHLDLGAGEEKAVAATKTFTSQMMALALLVAHWKGDEELLAGLRAVPGAIRQVLAQSEQIARAALRFTHAGEAWVLGRGLSLAVAQEISLKLKETSYIATQTYSSAEFQHGPIAALEKGAPVLLFALSDATAETNRQVVAKLQELPADLTVVSSDKKMLAAAQAPVAVPEGLHPVTEAFAQVVAGQLLALHLIAARGNDPDRPRHLSKVTQTI